MLTVGEQGAAAGGDEALADEGKGLGDPATHLSGAAAQQRGGEQEVSQQPRKLSLLGNLAQVKVAGQAAGLTPRGGPGKSPSLHPEQHPEPLKGRLDQLYYASN